jgi:hypothetical protein
MSEKPVHSRLRRLVDWINLTDAKKVHSLIDKVYKRKNLRSFSWSADPKKSRLQRTKRTTPLRTEELIAGLNPLLRGWGEYYKRAHVRKLFQRLDGWILRRIWSHRYRRWRNAGWKRCQRPSFTASTSLFG